MSTAVAKNSPTIAKLVRRIGYGLRGRMWVNLQPYLKLERVEVDLPFRHVQAAQ
jgi:hypothetical protein